MKRLICRFRGHLDRVIMLPEDIFGPYTYSRIECSRCGTVLETGLDTDGQVQRLTALLDECRDQSA